MHAPRQLSGRGLSYWTDGRGDDRVIYVTPGYRLVSLNAKTGQPIPGFGTNGIVDMKVGAVFGKGQQIDLETGEIGLHSTPTVTRRTRSSSDRRCARGSRQRRTTTRRASSERGM